jgi:medium-chain acyl-[acyl-carrier-protein] hydrolase
VSGAGRGKWLVAPSPQPGAERMLVIFPSAGSGVAPYVSWTRWLGTAVDARVLLLPGREERLREPPMSRLEDLLPPVVEAVREEGDGRNLVLYGHSMGALLAFEVARELERLGPGPRRLVVSGRRAPHLPERRRLHLMAEADLLNELRRFGGTPEAVLRDRELMASLLPAVRADLAVTENYVFTGGAPLAAPITAFGGTTDPAADESEIVAWGERTDGGFDYSVLAGGHFFIQGEAFRRSLSSVLFKDEATTPSRKER